MRSASATVVVLAGREHREKDERICEEVRETIRQIRQEAALLKSVVRETRRRIEASREIFLPKPPARKVQAIVRWGFVVLHPPI